jgi:transposase
MSSPEITTIGIDTAKHVFQIHGVDRAGHVIVQRRLRRDQMMVFFANLPSCVVGLEAGRGAHHWARALKDLGHNVRIMPPQYVKPYVKTNKNDAVDAAAICEAVTRPTMRFVPPKTAEQQGILAVHKVRDSLVRTRTAQANQIRGLLAEFGIIVRAGIHMVIRAAGEVIGDDRDIPPPILRPLLAELIDHIRELNRRIDVLEQRIRLWHRNNDTSQRLAEIPGVGPLTASAMVASLPDPGAFRNGRQLAAWLGLVPRQHSSGGRETLLGISKRGNVYLRTLLIHGARSIVTHPKSCAAPIRAWLDALKARRHVNVAVVALANKMTRMIWALLMHRSRYAPA